MFLLYSKVNQLYIYIYPPLFKILFPYRSLKGTEWSSLCCIRPLYLFYLSVQSLSHVRDFATPWTVAHQASLSITNSQSLLKLISIESVMPSSHLILCRPLLLLPPIPPSIRVFSNESTLCMRWSKYCSFSISPSNEHPGLTWSPLGCLFMSIPISQFIPLSLDSHKSVFYICDSVFVL